MFAWVNRASKTILASGRTVESTTVLVRVMQFSETQSLWCEVLLMDPSVHGRELREMVTGFSAPRNVGRVQYKFMSPGLRVYVYGYGFRICPLLSLWGIYPILPSVHSLSSTLTAACS